MALSLMYDAIFASPSPYFPPVSIPRRQPCDHEATLVLIVTIHLNGALGVQAVLGVVVILGLDRRLALALTALGADAAASLGHLGRRLLLSSGISLPLLDRTANNRVELVLLADLTVAGLRNDISI